ncbi:ASCH domain-containing protein [Nonomuraea sp. NPDC049655]|uniref:ASCH domain-containing protein n=1 Tax=unclassified Nonomuraea TaxID=2593643 RepID=UPI00342B5216
MWPRIDGRRVLALGTPGKVRTLLTDLTLSGAKTATAGLLPLDYEAEGEEVEHVGEHLILVNDAGEKAATIEITSVALVPFAEVPWEFAEAEGEGFTSIQHWRDVHQRYWSSLGHEVNDTSTIVCLHYRLLPA